MDLVFLVENKTAFELPLQFVANSNIVGRTEVSLEFQPQNPAKSKPSKYALDEMAEIRFYVPGTQAKGECRMGQVCVGQAGRTSRSAS